MYKEDGFLGDMRDAKPYKLDLEEVLGLRLVQLPGRSQVIDYSLIIYLFIT